MYSIDHKKIREFKFYTLYHGDGDWKRKKCNIVSLPPHPSVQIKEISKSNDI